MRFVLVALGTALGAAAVGLVANLLGLDGPLLYGLGGAALAVAVFVGTPYAFPPRGFSGSGFQSRSVVQTDEPAVRTEDRPRRVASTERERASLVGSSLEKNGTYASTPSRVAAGGTIPMDAFAVEVR